ncbi:NADP-dependent oxidoreductase [Nocardioides zeae]|uniref:NADP-dependent oxidoreductase n=1 Tax=Nocardioides imazamoxiresistens TaxID=3231893 RepID=A0ABU3PSS4_9ACTN|nr:NADP-dependent oxidoreductase [Nocardioides zeae]MDT9592249.1 NADP-dependent oxidoreductase [Nocardioides zeae]
MSPTTVSTQVQLVRRPEGWPVPEDFRTVQVTLDDLAPGEVRVRNEFVSVDPYMRGRMNDAKSYVPPFELDATMTGGAVGRVVESRDDALAVGTLVLHQLGWRDVAQAPAREFRAVPEVPGGAPSSLHLGVLGMPGLTAYVGLTAVAGVQEGDTVFVSGAAGAVGTAVGQVARLLGAGRVIGSAGSAEKVALLQERYGYDAAFDYKAGSVREQLAAAAPDGIDVYFDNVGGDHLEAALWSFNQGGRAAMCGAIGDYNADSAPSGPRNMFRVVTNGLTLKGFIVSTYGHLAGEFAERMGAWFAEGRIVHDETVVDGVDNAVDAFLSMMRGGNIGKMVVRV